VAVGVDSRRHTPVEAVSPLSLGCFFVLGGVYCSLAPGLQLFALERWLSYSDTLDRYAKCLSSSAMAAHPRAAPTARRSAAQSVVLSLALAEYHVGQSQLCAWFGSSFPSELVPPSCGASGFVECLASLSHAKAEAAQCVDAPSVESWRLRVGSDSSELTSLPVIDLDVMIDATDETMSVASSCSPGEISIETFVEEDAVPVEQLLRTGRILVQVASSLSALLDSAGSLADVHSECSRLRDWFAGGSGMGPQFDPSGEAIDHFSRPDALDQLDAFFKAVTQRALSLCQLASFSFLQTLPSKADLPCPSPVHSAPTTPFKSVEINHHSVLLPAECPVGVYVHAVLSLTSARPSPSSSSSSAAESKDQVSPRDSATLEHLHSARSHLSRVASISTFRARRELQQECVAVSRMVSLPDDLEPLPASRSSSLPARSPSVSRIHRSSSASTATLHSTSPGMSPVRRKRVSFSLEVLTSPAVVEAAVTEHQLPWVTHAQAALACIE
jgi:hypothetical protein